MFTNENILYHPWSSAEVFTVNQDFRAHRLAVNIEHGVDRFRVGQSNSLVLTIGEVHFQGAVAV